MIQNPDPNQNVALRHALAVAVVQKRRHGAQVQAWRERCAGLEAELERLRSGDHHPALSLLTALCDTAAAGAPESAPQPDPQAALANLRLWAVASSAVGAESQLHLGRVQRYLLLREAQRGGGAPTDGVLLRSPARALLEAIADSLEACIPDAPMAVSTRASPQLAEAARTSISTSAAALAGLCERPSELLGAGDAELLHEFASWLLGLACAGPAGEGIAGSGAAVGKQQQQVELGGSTVPPLPALASQVLHALSAGPGGGLVVLASTSAAMHSCVQALVAAITGEAQQVEFGMAAADQPGDGGAGAGSSEAALQHSFGVLASLLQHCLRGLPVWTAAATPSDELMRGVAGAVWAACESATLISLTHPEIARQVQRNAALFMQALQQISAPGV